MGGQWKTDDEGPGDKPKEGKRTAQLILTAVAELLENFAYQRTWIDGDD